MEYFDIRTPDGKVTGQIKERSEVHRDGDLHGTAHVWIVRRNAAGKWEVLLQKRSMNKDSHPGDYDISSAGHLPAGQDFAESALRELEEELGIRAALEELHFLYWRESHLKTEFHGKPWNNHELTAVYVMERDVEPEAMRLQPEEVESVLWVEYENCMEKMREGTLKHCVYAEEFQRVGEYLAGAKASEAGLPDAGNGNPETDEANGYKGRLSWEKK